MQGIEDLLGFVVCNYLLYLQVSGQFHMACGMLHLFGYQLPETHHRYLLATSFTDYWRRINIYWKDFMVRIFFNPVVFRLKRWPQPAALAAATAVVFLATWLLHGYQLYWLRGGWGFTVPDALFWGTLGRPGRDQRAARRPPAPGAAGAGRVRPGRQRRLVGPRAGRAGRQGRRHVHHDRRCCGRSGRAPAWRRGSTCSAGACRARGRSPDRDAGRTAPRRAVWFMTG